MTRQEEIDRAISMQLRSQAEALGVYRNRTAKGDGREEMLRRSVELRIGTMFGIVKGEITDSDGRATLEHDAVIYDQSSAACLFAAGHRRVVRVEAVAMTIEIKSELDASAIQQVEDVMKNGLDKLVRFYRPEQPLQFVETISRMKNIKVPGAAEQFEGTRTMLRDGLGALKGHQAIPPVFSAIFGYDGPTIDTAIDYMETVYVDMICVLGKYTLAKRTLGTTGTRDNIDVWGEGEDALGAFLCLTEGLLDEFRLSRQWVRPNLFRYYNHEANSSS